MRGVRGVRHLIEFFSKVIGCTLEFTEGFSQGLCNIGKFLRAQYDQCNQQNENEFLTAYAEHSLLL